MTVFADASAIVKLFATEPSADLVRDETGPFAVSALTQVEVASALWRKHREGGMTAQDARVLVDSLQWALVDGRFTFGTAVAEVAMSGGLLATAARLVARHQLRAGDAIQLASALAVRSVDPSCTGFLVFAEHLADAAAAEGFAVVPG